MAVYHLHRLPYEVLADAPPTQVVLALAMLRLDNRARGPGIWHPPGPRRWQKIHGLTDKAAAAIAAKT